MGNCVGGFKRRTRIAPWNRKTRTIVLCFLGLDGAGKTTVVKALQGEDFATVHPTVGFSRAEFMIKKHKIVAYDLGGGERIREIWPTYYAEVYGVVYVVDSAAISRLAENKEIVDSFADRPELVGKPMLFLLNKKDLPEPIDEMQFSDRFELHNLAKNNKTDIRVEGICAVKGSGKDIDAVITEGLEWLIERITDNYVNIEKGVQAALKALQDRQAQDRMERQHRLAMISATQTADSPSQEEHMASDENTDPVQPGPSTEPNVAQSTSDQALVPNGIATINPDSIISPDKAEDASTEVEIRPKSGSLQPVHFHRSRVDPITNSEPLDELIANFDYSAFEVRRLSETSEHNQGEKPGSQDSAFVDEKVPTIAAESHHNVVGSDENGLEIHNLSAPNESNNAENLQESSHTKSEEETHAL
ncbi:ADP-ribosylation factor family domain-containing protein [Ditylenchus destructor]|uniref:ADP-ribosylation factor family domain-containing protein n=1 Tax=Ditylenchus destructor TaxID=166010 RepID=A0AAD4N327_9BILA|nr:ADP-ribosylation factor family domain-containing protein [Ditylenchus destructor]